MKSNHPAATPDQATPRRRNCSPTPHTVQLSALLAVLALVLASTKALGQGTVNFSMTVPGLLSTRVYMPETNYCCWQKFGNSSDQIPPGAQTYSGALVSGSDFVAQLWAAPGANQPESVLMPASAPVPFRTGAAAGTVQGSTVTLAVVPADCPVATVQVRVWQALWYDFPIPTWNWALGGGYVNPLGKSLPFNVESIGGGTNPPPSLLNLRSFSLIANLLDYPVTPFIYVQPQHQSAPVGGNASFCVEVSCPATLLYTWRFNGTNLISYGSWYWPQTIEFAFPPPIVAKGIINASESHDFFLGFPSTNAMQLTNVQPSQAGIYSMVVTNITGGPIPHDSVVAVSSNAVLTVGNPGSLSVVRDDLQQIILNWDGVFFLQSATNVNGPFTDLPGPVVLSPYTNTDSSGPRFFRLRN